MFVAAPNENDGDALFTVVVPLGAVALALANPNVGVDIVVFEPDPKANAFAAEALVTGVLVTVGADGVLVLANAPNEIPVLAGNAGDCVAEFPKLNARGADVVVILVVRVVLVSVLACMLEPNVGGLNEGSVPVAVDLASPNEKVGVATVPPILESEVGAVSVVEDFGAAKVDVNDGGLLAKNVKPPRRGAESEVVVAGADVEATDVVVGRLNVTVGVGIVVLAALSVLVCGLSFCEVTPGVAIVLKEVETFVESVKPDIVVLDAEDVDTSLFSLFGGSTIFDLVVASAGAIKTDVVVAVLNVTEVIVFKLADVDVLMVLISLL